MNRGCLSQKRFSLSQLILSHFIRHLRFILRSAEELITSPADPAALRNKATASDSRMDAMETQQTTTTKRVSKNTAKLEEIEDGILNDS